MNMQLVQINMHETFKGQEAENIKTPEPDIARINFAQKIDDGEN